MFQEREAVSWPQFRVNEVSIKSAYVTSLPSVEVERYGKVCEVVAILRTSTGFCVFM